MPGMGECSGAFSPSQSASAISDHSFCQSIKLRSYFPLGLYLMGRLSMRNKIRNYESAAATTSNLNTPLTGLRVNVQDKPPITICRMTIGLQIRYRRRIEIIILRMDEEYDKELALTRNSFFQLQENFNHNLLVIKELEEENEKLITEVEDLKMDKYSSLEAAEERVYEAEVKLELAKKEWENQLVKVKQQHEEQMQNMVYMMNEKMMEEKRFQSDKFGKDKLEIQAEIRKCEETIRHFTIENSKLFETIKQLRLQKQDLSEDLEQALQLKDTFANKFALHEKELENLRLANEEWENVLREKSKEANREKQKVEDELAECKLNFKLKLKAMKDESAKKIQEMIEEREKKNRILLEDVREIKFRFDATCQENQALKLQINALVQENNELISKVKGLQKDRISQKELDYMKKMAQQQATRLKNELKTFERSSEELKEEVKEMNQRREEAEKTVERLKIGMNQSQKQLSEELKKNKKLEKDIRSLQNQLKTQMQGAMGGRYMKEQDQVNQVQAGEGVEYSKYFSEDMGPADELFFMQNSMPRSPKNINRQPAASSANHQLMKRIGDLQSETEQYKNTIKMMSEQIQRTKDAITQQMNLKNQEIKLCRDEIYILRQRINQKEHTLISLKNDNSSLVKQLQITKEEKQVDRKSLLETSELCKKLTSESQQMSRKVEELSDTITGLEEERRILEDINEELRAEIHQYKNRVQLYNDDSEEEESQEDFQDIKIQKEASKKPEEKPRKRSKSKSRSRSKGKSREKASERTPSQLMGGSKTSMKLKDLVVRKRQLELQGKRVEMERRQPQSKKSIEKVGTESQKAILENMRRKSKSKEKKLRERLEGVDYNRLLGRDRQSDDEDQSILL